MELNKQRQSYEAVPSNDKPRGHGNNKKEWGLRQNQYTLYPGE